MTHLLRIAIRAVRGWITLHSTAAVLLLTVLLACLFYGYSLAAGFAPYDDPILIFGNPAVRSIAASLHYFTHPVAFTSDLRSSGEFFYRPLFWLSLAADASVWGLRPAGFHATSLLLHVCNGLLLHLLLRRLQLSQSLALASAAVWLLLPINSEAVAWISARSYLLAACFVLTALLCSERYLLRPSKLVLLGYAGAGACALLSHEQGILLLPLTILIAAMLKAGRGRPALILCGTAAALDAAYLSLIHAVGVSGPVRWGAVSPAGLTLARYLGWMVLPLRMSVERSTDTPAPGWSAPAIAALVVTVALAGALIVLKQVPSRLRFGVAWIAICLVPFLGLVAIYQGMAERYLYLTSIGFAVALCVLCAETPLQLRPWLIGFTALWLTWGVVRLELRLRDWHDPIRLYQSSLRATPRSFKLHYNLGALYEERGDFLQALAAYRESLRMNLAYEPSIAGMGNAYLQMNDPATASKFYEQALLRNNNDVRTINNYGTALDRLGRLTDAKHQYMRAIALAPADDTAYCDLATLFYDAGDADVAEILFKKAIGVNGRDPLPYSNLAAIYTHQLQQGRPDRKELALAMYRKVLELDPGDASAISAVERLQR